jgi:hypothetical protein
MSLQIEVQEALCSAIYQMPFAELLGETENEAGRIAFFHIGERPKDIRVSVIRPPDKEEVSVKIEWRNYAADGRNPLKGEQVLRISTYAATQAMLMAPTQNVILRILEIYNDVLHEEGVAGMIADLVESPETESE